MTKVSPRQLALAHFLLCQELNIDSSIKRASTLKFISAQLNGALLKKTPNQRAAFVGYWLNARRPFKRANRATAVVLMMSLAGTNTTTTGKQLEQALKAEATIAQLAGLLE